MNRISWDKYFMQVADLISKRSVCLKTQVGAVLVKDSQILSTGYNGTASGVRHCKTCTIMDIEAASNRGNCPAVHAELNAIALAARKGICINGSTLYVNVFCCWHCLSTLINAGISEIVYSVDYTDNFNKDILNQSKIVTRRINGERETF